MEFRYWRFVTIALLGLVTCALLLLVLTEFHEEITDPWLTTLNQAIMKAVHTWTMPGLTRAMFVLSFIGSWKCLAPASSVLVLFLFFRHARDAAIIIAVAVGGSAALNVGLKLWFQRARPEVFWALIDERGFSFPSGRAVAAFCFYGTVTYLLLRRNRGRVNVLGSAALMIVVLGIGLSRVYLGVHYPSDIFAGYLVGAVWVCAVVLAARWLKPTGSVPRRSMRKPSLVLP
jgi:membrane-associated phospholipid phosphatase